jgi:hypothetical protein
VNENLWNLRETQVASKKTPCPGNIPSPLQYTVEHPKSWATEYEPFIEVNVFIWFFGVFPTVGAYCRRLFILKIAILQQAKVSY